MHIWDVFLHSFRRIIGPTYAIFRTFPEKTMNKAQNMTGQLYGNSDEQGKLKDNNDLLYLFVNSILVSLSLLCFFIEKIN